jgi:hypothetical protein
MDGFIFPLGSLVYVSPTGETNRMKGKVIGHTQHLDGSKAYIVSTVEFTHGGVCRHTLTADELVAA